jgi:hypothetical protein
MTVSAGRYFSTCGFFLIQSFWRRVLGGLARIQRSYMNASPDDLTDSELATLNTLHTVADTFEAIQFAAPESLIILDLDETLFLRNSTEEYLNSIYPRSAGAAFLLGIKALKPWRWFPARLRPREISRDWCLVVAATLFFPWTLLVWRWRAKRLARTYWNQTLLHAVSINPNAQVAIATLGFAPIVKPLLKSLPIALAQIDCNVICCRFWQGAADRAKGKLAMLREALGEAAVARAVVVTDSSQDEPLLAAAGTPCFVQWPEAAYIPAMSDVYLPLFYSERVKNPNKSHFVKRILMGHWAFLAIALSALAPHPVLNAFSLLLLTLSYWCIYEIGYQENDVIGEQYEKKPILSETYSRYKSQLNLNTAAPWLWAMGIALLGIFLLEVSKLDAPLRVAFMQFAQTRLLTDAAIWLIFLGVVRFTFGLYNRFNEEGRIWIYPVLQTQKLFGFTLLAGTSLVGAVLLISLAMSRWMHYCIYRCGGDRWRFPINLSCLVLFVMTVGAAAIGNPTPAAMLTWQAAMAIGYCLLRAIKDWKRVNGRTRLLTAPSVEGTDPQTSDAAIESANRNIEIVSRDPS